MTYDLAIIGGGPAGAAAVVYAARKQLKTVVITKDWLGQSYESTGIENWIGTPKITGLDLSKQLENHAKSYSGSTITFQDGQLATALAKSGKHFTVTSSTGATYDAKTILIASGSRRRKLDIPGAAEYENKGIIYCASCDGPLYAGEDVVVVGGGNAGFETCAQLLAYCTSVTLLVRSDVLKADPGTIEAVKKDPKMKIITFATPKQIFGEKFLTGISYTDKAGAEHKLDCKAVFVEIGSIPNTDYAADMVKRTQFNQIVVDPRTQMTSQEGIWAAGDCTDGLYHQNNIAAGDAVKAIEDIYLYVHRTS